MRILVEWVAVYAVQAYGVLEGGERRGWYGCSSLLKPVAGNGYVNMRCLSVGTWRGCNCRPQM